MSAEAVEELKRMGSLPRSGTCEVDEDSAVMDLAYFNGLREYSASVPTGTSVGKRWKAHRFGGWWLAEYVPHPDPKLMGIYWRRITRVSP